MKFNTALVILAFCSVLSSELLMRRWVRDCQNKTETIMTTIFSTKLYKVKCEVIE